MGRWRRCTTTSVGPSDNKALRVTRNKYDRRAAVYDFVEAPMERFVFSQWRRHLWSQVSPRRILEIGVGTGRNMPHYPVRAQVTAVDLSSAMLERAAWRAHRLGLNVELVQMPAETLAFANDIFDEVVATFVFCSVVDPLASFREAARVCKPDGVIRLLEHVRPEQPIMGRLADIWNPVALRMVGDHINRPTVENARRAGLEIVRVDRLGPMGIFRLIAAKPYRT